MFLKNRKQKPYFHKSNGNRLTVDKCQFNVVLICLYHVHQTLIPFSLTHFGLCTSFSYIFFFQTVNQQQHKESPQAVHGHTNTI